MRRPRLLALLALSAALTVTSESAAQRANQLPVGARVRVRQGIEPSRTVTGVLVRADSLGLTVAPRDGAPARTIPAAEITRLERYLGTRSTGAAFGRGAARGALVGVSLSAMLMGLALVHEQRDRCGDCMITAPMAAAIVAVPLTVGSSVLGGLFGLGFRERWARVAYP